MPVPLRKKNIAIATKKSTANGLDLKFGEIGTDGQNIFIGNSTLKKRLTNLMPLGVIVAWHPIGFTSTGNVGLVNLSTSINLPYGFVEADGRLIEDEDSPFNGTYVPNLTSNIFLKGGNLGDSGPGVVNGNNGDNSITIATNHLPPHTHGVGSLSVASVTSTSVGNHTHSSLIPQFNIKAAFAGPYPFIRSNFSPSATSVVGDHTHTFSLSSANFAGATGDGGFANDPVLILPKYLSVKFIIKIK